jgi:transposase
VVRVSGKGSGRVCIAGIGCLRPGHPGRFVWRTIAHRGRKGERSSFTEADYAAPLEQVHRRLRAPIVLAWGNLNTHVGAAMRTLIAARAWLTVVRLPGYAADFDPSEGAWSHVERGIANTAVHGVDHLADIVKHRLRACQQQPDLIAGFLAQTGMTLLPEPP